MKKSFITVAAFLVFFSLGIVLYAIVDVFAFSSLLSEKIFKTKTAPSQTSTTPRDHEPEEFHAVVLSAQALRNIGLTDDAIREIEVSAYDKTMSFPAMLVDRPGRSTFRVPAPFSGVVQKIYVEPGMVVQSGQPLFDVMLTHEDLIACQNDLIGLYQKRDMINRELERLDGLATDIAPKTKRDTVFQKAEIDSQIDTQRSILRLHGIGEEAITETIEKRRQLIQNVTVFVPRIENDPNDHLIREAGMDQADHEHDENCKQCKLIQMESLFVNMGQLVGLGEPLCQLADLSLLNIEGRASTNDESVLARALMEHCNVTASFDGERVEGLHIRYIDTRIDPASRSLKFYVELPNSVVVKDENQSHHHPWAEGKTENSCEIHRHYVNWRFRPGQRCELNVEYDTIPRCIVVPREAVAESGNDAFLFEWTGSEPDGEQRKIWTKRPVHVLHRSKSRVAIAHDGSIFPGAKIAARGAGQLLVALTSGGGQLQSACPCGDH